MPENAVQKTSDETSESVMSEPVTAEDFLAAGHTPMMAQYLSVKKEYPDCLLFYRMGDFYELFFEDAETAADVLDITLTARGKSQGDDIPMAGVPFHSYEPYLAKLIQEGYKVGICEQVETPEEARERVIAEGKPKSKALVRREVVRLVTQGTLTEDTLLDARENNYLAALANAGGQYGVAWLELSTGEFYTEPVKTAHIGSTLERIQASEILIPESFVAKDEIFRELATVQNTLTKQPDSLFNTRNAESRLTTVFKIETLEAFGEFSRAEITAAGALLDYVNRTQVGHMPRLEPPRQINSGAVMEIDAATRKNLELIRTLSGEKRGSLLSCIDRTLTSGGARLLQKRLAAPLTAPQEINARLNEIECLINDKTLRETANAALKQTPDMERALGRLTVNRGGPRDLGILRDGLRQAESILALLNQTAAAKEPLATIIEKLFQSPEVQDFADTLKKALKDDLPMLDREGGFIRQGFDARLDELRTLRDESRQLIAKLQDKYKQSTEIKALKICYNKILGYYIEVPSKQADPLMVGKNAGTQNANDNPFVHRQTMKNAVRFTTPELAELERDLSSAGDKALAIEQKLCKDLTDKACTLSNAISRIARALAELDVAGSLAVLAIERRYSRPVIDNSTAFDIQGGRHPVVEQALQKSGDQEFVPNDCDLSEAQKLWLLTGPNMAGKSTFLRQNALIAILAQMGSYVPAEHAHIGTVDRLFSRVGAADDLARGRSTFMVEMVETATILNLSTERSLVILDEIGRGTATFDGLSIAWACIEHLHETVNCRCLFATHYHELTSLASKLKSLSCHAMQVKEWQGDIIFLHKVAQGSADHSYGIHVAQIAGLPPVVITRARQVLELLQSGDQSSALTRLAEDLPLFSTVKKETAAPASSPLESKMAEIIPDNLTPREALALLYELKDLAET